MSSEFCLFHSIVYVHDFAGTCLGARTSAMIVPHPRSPEPPCVLGRRLPQESEVWRERTSRVSRESSRRSRNFGVPYFQTEALGLQKDSAFADKHVDLGLQNNALGSRIKPPSCRTMGLDQCLSSRTSMLLGSKATLLGSKTGLLGSASAGSSTTLLCFRTTCGAKKKCRMQNETF